MPSKTYSLGLIGYPLGHSLSPQIHGAALHALGISGEYSLYPVAPFPEGKKELAALLDQVKNDVIRGLNVTIPHKQNVMPMLDELTPAAQAIGAVNTIFVQDGRLIGDNTDAASIHARKANDDIGGKAGQNFEKILIIDNP